MEMVMLVVEGMVVGRVEGMEVVAAVVEGSVAVVHRAARVAEGEWQVATAAAVDFAVDRPEEGVAGAPAVDGELAAALAYPSDSTVEGSDRDHPCRTSWTSHCKTEYHTYHSMFGRPSRKGWTSTEPRRESQAEDKRQYTASAYY